MSEQYEVTIGVIVTAENVEEALEIAEQSVGDNAAVMTVQIADRSLLTNARKREADIATAGASS
jgi:ABC-type lipopolysaccharide export system ATPase subunit